MHTQKTKIQIIENTARQLAIGILTRNEAKSRCPNVSFESLSNGRIYWFDRRTGFQGSQAARQDKPQRTAADKRKLRKKFNAYKSNTYLD